MGLSRTISLIVQLPDIRIHDNKDVANLNDGAELQVTFIGPKPSSSVRSNRTTELTETNKQYKSIKYSNNITLNSVQQ
jgi:hypothetical protein